MSAIRLARGFTSRDRILKFAGCYHGHADQFLASAGSGLATLGIPSSPGVPERRHRRHDRRRLQRHRRRRRCGRSEYGEGLAAILVEPVAGNMGCVPPRRAFSRRCALLCDASGALLVFDEVITGFRVARGGAQERLGVTPDLTILGKIVGGGLPLAAFGGRGEIMERLAPAGARLPGRHAERQPARDRGGALRPAPAARSRGVRRARATLGAARRRARAVRPRAAGRRDAHALRRPRRAGRAVRGARPRRFGELFRGLLERGIYIAPSQYECWFPSLAHDDDVIDETIEAVADVLGS